MFLIIFNKAAHQINFLLSQHLKIISELSEIYYASIKTAERWAEKTRELSESLFDPKEIKTVRREVNCKVIMYKECNNDEYNEQWLITTNWLIYHEHNESNEK